MKACLMKVNYDPKYVCPVMTKPLGSLQTKNSALSMPKIKSSSDKTRLNATKEIYAAKLPKHESGSENSNRLQRVHKAAPDFVFSSMKASDSDKQREMKNQGTRENTVEDDLNGVDQSEENVGKKVSKSAQKRNGSKSSVKLVPLKESNGPYGSYCSEDPKIGASTERLTRRHTQTNFPVFANKPKINYNSRSLLESRHNKDQVNVMPQIQRSKTVLPPERVKFRSVSMIEMERRARIEAERAVREKKIFSIFGPYPCLRMALRKRGWVEKFQSIPNPSEIELKRREKINTMRETNDNANSSLNNLDKIKVPPWEEENGYYGLMSYLVRNSTPTFMFTVKSSDVDSRVIKSNQLVNHFGQSKNFTTKAGLCLNLRSAFWYEDTDPYTFFPRCYKADMPDERAALIDDFHWTACVSFVRSFCERYKNSSNIPRVGDEPGQPGVRHPRLPLISNKALDLAVQQIEKFLKCRGHCDIDDLYETDLVAACEWEQFISWYTLFVHEGCDLQTVTVGMVESCSALLDRLREHWPQFEIDGVRNMWIIKPGALSRGRGIQCSDSLENILKLIEANESTVVQKYIERPFLVYKTKFDIRQWFLVTDWNPLTIWFYKDNYLRFCSREFTLQDCSPAVHLSNNSVTKHFQNGPRSARLPEDNTWTSSEFIDYLEEKGQAHLWKERVVPGLKNAIICSLLCTQEYIEGRKCAFELYGADFMITQDFQPWLLEINSSPSMAQTTHATADLVEKVLEDTIKVVLDRRLGKCTDTGRFELAYKQQAVQDPPPVDSNLCIQGKRVRQKNGDKNSKHQKSAK